MAKAARTVRSTSKFAGNPLTPLDAQEFLDFFGRGESSPRVGKLTPKLGDVPKALSEFAPSFVPRKVTQPVFGIATLDVDNPHAPAEQIGTRTGFEHANTVATRNQGSNRRDTPVWKQAYDAALISFNKQADVRKADEAKRKQQRESRKERDDRAVAEGRQGGQTGTTLITGVQGFLGGQGGAGSLLR